MAANRFYVLDDELAPWTLGNDAPLPWPDCRYFGQVLAAIDRSRPDMGLRFVLTKWTDGPLPLRGDDVVVICIGDELCCVPGYAHDVRLVAKTYGVRRTPNALPTGSSRSVAAVMATLVQEVIVQARRSPSLSRSGLRTVRRGRRPLVVDVPLGTYLLEDVPFVAFEDRPLDVSYLGSRFNRPKEARRRVPTQKMRSRRELEETIQWLRTCRPDIRLGTNVIRSFGEASGHRSVYSRMMMDSRIALCPRGGSLETYRFFEAVSVGCVPVTEKLPSRDFYTGSPAVQVGCWSELPALLESLLEDSAGLHARHQAALRWWAERCSPAAVAGRLLLALEDDPPRCGGA